MRCDLCGFAEATQFVPEVLPSGEAIEAGYCERCYEAKFINPLPDPGPPRFRFRITHILIVVIVFAIVNGWLAWMFRIDKAPQSEQRRTVQTELFIFCNVVLGLLVVMVTVGNWLQRMKWYRRTRGLVPFPRPKMFEGMPLRKRVVAIGLFLVGCVVFGVLFGLWGHLSQKIGLALARWWFPGGTVAPLLGFAVTISPFLLLLVSPLFTRRGRTAVAAGLKRSWQRTPRAERVMPILAFFLPIALVVVLLSGAPMRLLGGPNMMSTMLLLAALMGLGLLVSAVDTYVTRRR